MKLREDKRSAARGARNVTDDLSKGTQRRRAPQFPTIPIRDKRNYFPCNAVYLPAFISDNFVPQITKPGMTEYRLITGRDLKYGLCFLLGFGGLCLLPYASARWMPGMTEQLIWLAGLVILTCVVRAVFAGGGLLLRPFVFSPRDVRWSQLFIRFICAVCIGGLVIWKKSWPSPASVGDWHRLKDRGNPEDFREFAKWLLKQAAEKPAMANLAYSKAEELLTLPETARFASISEIWGPPSYISSETGEHASAVTITWGGGFGHWSVDVRFDTFPVLPNQHQEVWKWQDGLYFSREIQ